MTTNLKTVERQGTVENEREKLIFGEWGKHEYSCRRQEDLHWFLCQPIDALNSLISILREHNESSCQEIGSVLTVFKNQMEERLDDAIDYMSKTIGYPKLEMKEFDHEIIGMCIEKPE